MKKGLTELVFVLDRSGSMSGLESDTIGGFNAMLEKQKALSGDCVVTSVLFDDRYELLHDRIRLAGVAPLTSEAYYVRGNTALLDAIGRTIDKIGGVQQHTAPDEQAEKVLFVIITDGMENSSREYRYERVREMIERQKERYGWEFLFLGANIDAISVASRFGIAPDRAVTYCPDGEGTRLNYEAVSSAAKCVREGRPVEASWKKSIEEDHKKRGARR
ncbi:MAG TPA: vWA domain-containing protein [Candidatus Cryosericum sp.]|nr:vWA domain-containing protein [Candidatus Cryosericum sp.]